jgi:hypothetical protein
MPAKMNLAASRNVAWAPTIDLFYAGGDLPLGGASIAMEIRLYPGAAGSPLVTLASIPFEDRPPVAPSTQRCLRLWPVISQAALEAFPTGLNQPEPGEADIFAYDIIITYADDQQDKLALGSFILEPGVTLI